MSRRCACVVQASIALALLCISQTAHASSDGHEFSSLLGFELNVVTLDDIRERLGDAPVVEHGHAADHTSSICYRAHAGVVRFLSAEPGGEVRELLGFELADTRQEGAEQCVPLPPASAGANLQVGGVRLGMTRREFAAAVGENVYWEGDLGRRFFASSSSAGAQGLGVLPKRSVAIVARFAGDRLVEVKVWKLQSD